MSAIAHTDTERRSASANRDLQILSLLPAAEGDSHINIGWLTTVESANPYDPVNLATEIIIKVNGLEVDRIRFESSFVGDTDSCSDNCGACIATCFVGVPGYGCACGKLRSTLSSPVAIKPGDKLEVSLVAAPGGLPDKSPDGSRVTTIVGSVATIWEAEMIERCPGSTPDLSMSGITRAASSVLIDQSDHSTVHCDGNTGHSCLNVWRACRDDGYYTDCIPVQTPGGGTNGASCVCGAKRP
ncbi:hypothetical protein [Marinibactrum halimedae]|uniref:Uncharacterized protein n=1 Tax=Marinibactrum halimedae TaxID=1444977 RepID=A0AA37WLR6_9GAMM|nr:hypothetical protein [Marinibactrum halimedae]MCD9461272.1 hypothetical protein [Marinibactrum halimedae]GLS25908.1 hypothetical protein GCM10007877_16220 [Marinibactrum halimedae]